MIVVDADGVALPAGFAAAVDRGEQTVLARLMLDFAGDGYAGVDDLSRWAGSWGVDRSLSTEFPAQVRLATGYAAAELTADLAGGDPADDSTNAAWYFTRGSSSPIGTLERIRRPVVADVGYLTDDGPVYVRRFTGLSRALPTTAAAGTAQLAALDLRERLRNTVDLIPTDGQSSGADGTWIVFQALAANGVYAGPAPRTSGSLLWLPFYGSLNAVTDSRDPAWFASIAAPGTLGGDIRPVFRTGPFVLAADDLFHHSDTDYQRIVISTFPTGITWDAMVGRLEMWVLGVPSPTTGIPSSRGRIYGYYYNNGVVGPTPRLGVRHTGKLFYDTFDSADVLVNTYESTFVMPGDGQFHFVGIAFNHTAQTVTFRLDARQETVATAIAGVDEIPTAVSGIQFTSYVSCSDIHLHGPVDPAAPWLSETVDVQAQIDRSALELVASIEGQPREAWDLIGELASAEQAVVYFDEAGVFRYRTRARLADTTGQTVQRSLTAVGDLLDLQVDDGIDQIRNIIQVAYDPVETADLFGYAYTDTTQRVIPSFAASEFTVSFSDPVVQLQPLAFLQDIFTFNLFPPVDPYLVATLNSDFSDDAGAVLAYANVVTVDVTDWNTRAASVRVANGTPFPLYVVALGLRGLVCRVGNTVVVEARDEASIQAWGPQPLQLDATQWVQTSGIAQSLANALLGDLKDPRRSISRMSIVGDPRLQLGDRVALEYPSRPELDGEYWLTAVADDVSAGSYTQQVSVREATTVLRWGVGRWGVNTWGAG